MRDTSELKVYKVHKVHKVICKNYFIDFRLSAFDLLVLRTSGRGAFQTAVKFTPRGGMERLEVRMQAQVAKTDVKVIRAENPRFPGQRESSLG